MVALAVTAFEACGLALLVRVRTCTSKAFLLFCAAGGGVPYLLALVALDDRVGRFYPKAVEAKSDSLLEEENEGFLVWGVG